MREFFKGWRRKLGCVLLGVACALTCGWVRSLETYDHVNMNLREWRYAFASIDGRIWLFRTSAVEEGKSTYWFSGAVSERTTDKSGQRRPFDPNRPSYKLWLRWEVAGFHLSAGEIQEPVTPVRFTNVLIPYSWFVIPLTLLSADLLIRKPRKTTKAGNQPETTHA